MTIDKASGIGQKKSFIWNRLIKIEDEALKRGVIENVIYEKGHRALSALN